MGGSTPDRHSLAAMTGMATEARDPLPGDLGLVAARVAPRWSHFLTALNQLDDEAFQDPTLAITLVFAVNPEGIVTSEARPLRAGLAGFDDAAIDLLRDIDLLTIARREAASLLSRDPELLRPEHAVTSRVLAERWAHCDLTLE